MNEDRLFIQRDSLVILSNPESSLRQYPRVENRAAAPLDVRRVTDFGEPRFKRNRPQYLPPQPPSIQKLSTPILPAAATH